MRRLALLALVSLSTSAFAQQTPTLDPETIQAMGADFMKAMNSVMSGNTNPTAVVDFRELKSLLPTELAGLQRKNTSGERSGALGMTVSYAVADYQSEDGQYLSIKISDMGGAGSLGTLMSSWSLSEIDRESDTGYERTTMLKGQKALEKYERDTKSGEIQIMAAQRFMIEISGTGVSEQTMREAVDKLDLDKLATLQPKPQP